MWYLVCWLAGHRFARPTRSWRWADGHYEAVDVCSRCGRLVRTGERF
jgi:hypothetical protein